MAEQNTKNFSKTKKNMLLQTESLEVALWKSADKLRKNIDAAVYVEKMVEL